MERQRTHSIKDCAMKWGLLVILIAFIVYSTPTFFKVQKESPVPTRVANNELRRDQTPIDINKIHRSDGTVHNAKLLLHPVIPQRSALQGRKVPIQPCKASQPTPYESSWMHKLSRVVKTKSLAPRSGVACSIMGVIWAECGQTVDNEDSREHVEDYGSSSTASSCYAVFGVSWFCDRLEVEASHDGEHYKTDEHSKSKIPGIHAMKSTVKSIATNFEPLPHLVNQPDVCEWWPSHSSFTDFKALSTPEQAGPLVSRSADNSLENVCDWWPTHSTCCMIRPETPGCIPDTESGKLSVLDQNANHATGSQSVPRRGRLHRCKSNPKACGCRQSSSGSKAASVPAKDGEITTGSPDLIKTATLPSKERRTWCDENPGSPLCCSNPQPKLAMGGMDIDPPPCRVSLNRCQVSPNAPYCPHPTVSKVASVPDCAEKSIGGPATLPTQESVTGESQAPTGKYHVDHLQHPSEKAKTVERRDSPHWNRNTVNQTVDCTQRKPYDGPTRSLKDRMDDPCTKQSHVLRTWVDEWLPPKECASFEGSQRKKCLKVSKDQSRITITVYTILSISAVCGVALLIMTILRLRRRRKAPLLDDSKRSSGTTTPRYAPEARSVGGNGFVADQLPRVGGVPERQESGIQPGATLDGANDGWTQWIFKKSRGQDPRTYSPTPRSRPPRIPSLNLPKPSFATMRKASGLGSDPETISRAKSRASKKAKSGPRVNWGSTV